MVRVFRAIFVLVVLLIIAGLIVVNFYGDPDVPDATLAAKYAPSPPSQFIDLPSGAHVHFRDQGVAGAPVLVLLHGSNASLHTWEPWVQILGQQYRVITVDLPSHGLTGAVPSNDYSQAGMANFVDEFTTALHVPRFALGGNSMGGGVAARFTLMYPSRVSKLILVDASGIPSKMPTDPGMGFRIARIPVIQNIMLYVSPRALFEDALRKAFYDKTKVTAEMVDRYWELNRRVGNRAATLKRFQTPPDTFLAEHVGEIKTPTLIIWGDRDTLVPLDVGETYRDAIKGSQFLVYRDVGHIPMEEVADRSAEAVRVFLEKP